MHLFAELEELRFFLHCNNQLAAFLREKVRQSGSRPFDVGERVDFNKKWWRTALDYVEMQQMAVNARIVNLETSEDVASLQTEYNEKEKRLEEVIHETYRLRGPSADLNAEELKRLRVEKERLEAEIPGIKAKIDILPSPPGSLRMDFSTNGVRSATVRFNGKVEKMRLQAELELLRYFLECNNMLANFVLEKMDSIIGQDIRHRFYSRWWRSALLYVENQQARVNRRIFVLETNEDLMGMKKAQQDIETRLAGIYQSLANWFSKHGQDATIEMLRKTEGERDSLEVELRKVKENIARQVSPGGGLLLNFWG